MHCWAENGSLIRLFNHNYYFGNFRSGRLLSGKKGATGFLSTAQRSSIENFTNRLDEKHPVSP